MLSKKKQTNVKGPLNPSVELSQSKIPIQPIIPNRQSFKTRKIKEESTSSKSIDTEDTKINGKVFVKGKQAKSLPPQGSGDTVTEQQVQVLDGIITHIGNVLSGDNERQRQRDLQRLIKSLSDWESIDDTTLVGIVKELQKYVEFVDDKFNSVIQQVLLGNWYTRSNKVVKQMESFVSELIVHRPGFVGTVILCFVTKFSPQPFDNFSKLRIDTTSSTEEKVFGICHRNLQRIIASFPMKEESSVKCMGHVYPYMGKCSHIHYCFVSNALQALDYLPNVRGQLFHVLIHKLARIDVNIPRDDLQALHHQHESDLDRSLKSEEMFEMELDDSAPTLLNPLIETLDVCLNLVFKYINNIWTDIKSEVKEDEDDDDEAEGPWWRNEDERDRLLNSFLEIFGTEILPSFGLNNVQFLYFYLLKLHPSFLSRFLDFLWKKATNINASPILRIQAMAYLSGLLARARFISIETVKRWLSRMCAWANSYASQRSKTAHWATVNIQAHGPFYAVCQTVFYVFAFRNKELLGTKCVTFTRSLELGRLLTSELNPLKACEEGISSTFVKAAHQHQISYCGTVLERNQLATIPTITQQLIGAQSDHVVATQLEAFFPFDPFLLPRSKQWIEEIHGDYEPYLGDIAVEATTSSRPPPDEDTIEMELGSYTESNRSLRVATSIARPSKLKSDDDVSFID